MRSPQVEAATGLPPKVTIYEVGPRDGLQNEKTVVPAATKVEFIRRLEAAGLGTIETTSFVPARWVPQMGDAEEVLAGLGADGLGRRRPALVPNERGLDRAEELGLTRDRDLRVGHRDLRAEEPQPVGDRAVRHVRAGREARPRGRDVGAGLRLDVLRRPVGGARPGRAGRRHRRAAHGPRLPRAEPRRHDRRRHDRPRAPAARGARRAGDRHRPRRRALPRHVRPGARQHDGRPARRRLGRRRVGRRPRRLPLREVAPPATSPPRTSSGPCTAPGVETGVDLDALVETSVWMAQQLGRPSPSNVVRALAGA